MGSHVGPGLAWDWCLDYMDGIGRWVTEQQHQSNEADEQLTEMPGSGGGGQGPGGHGRGLLARSLVRMSAVHVDLSGLVGGLGLAQPGPFGLAWLEQSCGHVLGLDFGLLGAQQRPYGKHPNRHRRKAGPRPGSYGSESGAPPGPDVSRRDIGLYARWAAQPCSRRENRSAFRRAEAPPLAIRGLALALVLALEPGWNQPRKQS